MAWDPDVQAGFISDFTVATDQDLLSANIHYWYHCLWHFAFA
jgi:hypothetical protein